MLTLSYNGQNIPLDDNFSIRLTWVNPACYFDKIPGDYGVGIDIPVNEYSRTYFGNPHRFEKYTPGSEFVNDRKFENVEIRYSGMLLMSGTLNITNATPETYTGWLQSDVGVMGEEQREKYINELPWNDDGTTDTDFVNKADYIEGEDDYCCAEIHNLIWWDDKGRVETETIKYFNEDGEEEMKEEDITVLTTKFKENFLSYINQRSGDNSINVIGIDTLSTACVLSPFLFLSFAVKEILKMCEWYIEKNILTGEGIESGKENDVFEGLFIYNNWSIVKNSFATSEQVISVYDDVTHQYSEKTVNQIETIYWEFDTVKYNNMVPRIKLADFLISLQNYLNIVFFFKPGHKVDIIDREAIMDTEAIDLADWFLDEWIMGERKNVKLKFVSEYDKEDRMYGDEFHDLSDRLDDILEAVETFDELEAITTDPEGSIRLVIEENNYYEFKWSVEVGLDELRYEHQLDIREWRFISTGPQPYYFNSEGNDEEEINTGASCLKMNNEIGWPIANGRPQVLQKGNFDMIKNVWNDFSLRLMYYHGRDYAYTTNIDDTMDLNWEEDNGIFDVRWKKWSRFWANRLPVEGKFALPMNMIYYVVNNITNKFRTRHGEFLIEEMEVEIGLNLVGNTTIRGYKI